MKINKSQYLALALVIAFVLTSATSYAQLEVEDIMKSMGDTDFEGDVGDEPDASISSLIALGLAVGGFLGIRQTRK
jgi:hypothetical protein